jgi:hypothetical protein
LLETSDVVLTGRVVRLDAGWDPQVTALYTYVTIDVTDVIKGRIADRHLVLKQLGGALADVALAVPAQPTFTAGENALLFLEVRPRDGTLYTAGLWRGKWTITEDAQSGLPVAVRNHPPSVTSDRRDEARDLHAWRAFRAELVTASRSAPPSAVNVPVIGRPRGAVFETTTPNAVAPTTIPAFRLQHTLNSIAVPSGRVVQLMAALNQYGNPIQYNVTTFEAENAVSLGFGFGSQGLQLSDIANYNAGNHCASDWCANFVRFAGQVPLELQTIAASDPMNAAGGTGSITVLLPFALKLHTQILEVYIQDLQVAYDPASANYATYSQAYQQAFRNAAAVVGGR